MKIGILTQPLCANYGGFMQNWALQQTLKKLGHEPITIDYAPCVGVKTYILENIKCIAARLFFPNKRRPYTHLYYKRRNYFEAFVNENIICTKTVRRYSKKIIENYKFDALVVGSDQVWRPKYNLTTIEDMFFSFTKTVNIKKIAYAASFGSSDWEFTELQTNKVRFLSRCIDYVSVREPAGVYLCNQYLGIDATLVLDPTLLLSKEDYYELIKNVEKLHQSPYLAAYVLTPSLELENYINNKASELGLIPIIIRADSKAMLSVYQWLAMIRDASYIITDSFHGSIFSIIFEKEFECLGNDDRGNSRFEVIKRLQKNRDIEEMRQSSINFLKKALK